MAPSKSWKDEFKHVPKDSVVMVPQHLWPILVKTDQYIKDHAQELVNELEQKGYIERVNRGFKVTEDGYNYMWKIYTVKIICPHCGKEI